MKIGDKILITEDLEAKMIQNPEFDIVVEMLEFVGKEATITGQDEQWEDWFFLDVDNGHWYWRKDLLILKGE